MTMTWYTSDTHFSHKNIIEFCSRPFRDTDHMDAEMIRRWNSVVGENDVVFHLGDVALGPIGESLPKIGELNGYKVLISGNHDRIFRAYSKTHQARFDPEYRKVFDEIYTNFSEHELSDGSFVNLSHFPYTGDSHDGDRYTDDRMRDNGLTLLHGHTHSNEIVSRSDAGTLQVHVGVDSFNYFPVSEDQIITLIDSQKEL